MTEESHQPEARDAERQHATGHGEVVVVGIGASAGGIRALRSFFNSVPSDSGLAYVVILHLSPDHDSKLAEVLQATATIPVTQVRETLPVERDTSGNQLIILALRG